MIFSDSGGSGMLPLELLLEMKVERFGASVIRKDGCTYAQSASSPEFVENRSC